MEEDEKNEIIIMDREEFEAFWKMVLSAGKILQRRENKKKKKKVGGEIYGEF